ncbi:MAG: translation initiation factor IF-3 [Bacilli bacterium]
MEVFNINKVQNRNKDVALINEKIRASKVLLIGDDGEKLGVKPINEALQMAYGSGLDLVCVAPNAKTPVCRLMDYNKFRYEQQKRARVAKKNQTIVSIKEIQVSPVISENDFNTKVKAGIKFLEKGNKLKVVLSFRRRARMLNGGHPNMDMIYKYMDAVKEYATVENQPKLEGRNVVAMMIAKKENN